MALSMLKRLGRPFKLHKLAKFALGGKLCLNTNEKIVFILNNSAVFGR